MANTEKYTLLVQHLRKMKRVALAFSGGVDSTLLLYAAHEALRDEFTTITLQTPYMAEWEMEEAKRLAEQYGVRQHWVSLDIHPTILHNPSNRCYLCKKILFETLQHACHQLDIPVLIEGTHADDKASDRPGMKALKELHISSPLNDLHWSKAEIRETSKALQLPTWNKPAYACLMTRIPFDTEVTPTLLRHIENAEKVLHGYGYPDVRVRVHSTSNASWMARIELKTSDQVRLINDPQRVSILTAIKQESFMPVSLDLEAR